MRVAAREEQLKRYVVRLTPDEKRQLETLTAGGSAKVRRFKRALILLAANAGETDEVIAAKVRVHALTVERVRKRFVEESLEAALSERPRLGKPRLLKGRQEAYLVALACSQPPAGRAQWSMQLLADQFVELGVVGSISDETVRRALKRGISSPGSEGSGASQPSEPTS
jgi:transposase